MGEQVIHDACELVGRSHNADLGPRRGLQVGYLHTALNITDSPVGRHSDKKT